MGRSIGSQVAQLQRETVPGVAETDAMVRPMGLKLTPGVNTEGGTAFRATGFTVPTAYMDGDMWSTWAVEGIQDFNSLGLVAASVFGAPVTTPVAEAPGAYRHVFTPPSSGAADLVSYTAQYGDDVMAFEAAMLVFQALTIGVERGNLTLSSNAISRLFDENATLATTGVTDMPAISIPPTGYNVYADDTWAALGTTKMLACYRAEVGAPDKYTPDAPINSEIAGFESLVQNVEIDYSSNWTFGLDAVAKALITTFKTGAVKFLRLAADGPIIGGTTRYGIILDTCTRITSLGSIGQAPGSPTIVLPFDGTLMHDPVSNKFAELTLINTTASY